MYARITNISLRSSEQPSYAWDQLSRDILRRFQQQRDPRRPDLRSLARRHRAEKHHGDDLLARAVVTRLIIHQQHVNRRVMTMSICAYRVSFNLQDAYVSRSPARTDATFAWSDKTCFQAAIERRTWMDVKEQAGSCARPRNPKKDRIYVRGRGRERKGERSWKGRLARPRHLYLTNILLTKHALHRIEIANTHNKHIHI